MIIKILKTCRRLNTIFIDLHNVKAYKKAAPDMFESRLVIYSGLILNILTVLLNSET